jgi:hypothetical protein
VAKPDVIARFMRATQFICYLKMGCPDKPGNDGMIAMKIPL